MNLHNLFSKEPLNILGLLPDSVIVDNKSFIYVPVFVCSVRFVETEKILMEVSLEETRSKFFSLDKSHRDYCIYNI